MSSSNKSEATLITEIKELKQKLSFMEMMRGEKFDSNELDFVKLKLELEKSRRGASTIEKRHELLYSQPYLGIIYFDEERTVVDCNKRFSEIVGCSRKGIIGHNIFNIFENKEILFSIKKTLDGSSSTFEGEYLKPSNNEKIFIRGHFITGSPENNGSLISAGIFEDITISKKTELELKLLAHSFQNISECVVISDSDNTINYINNAFIKLYGYSKDEILGEKVKILRSLNNPKKINDAVYKPKNYTDTWQGTLLNVKKDGSDFPVFLSSATIKDSDGNNYARIGIIRDITKEKKIEEELIAAKTKAELSDRMKSEFLGQMSHEIRTPVNVILNVSNMILEDHYLDADEDTISTFSILDSAGKRIIRTIDLILNMAEIQVGAYNYSIREFDLFAEMYNSFYNEYLKLAEEKDLEFEWRKETQDTKISADYYSVSQIFTNILHNSIQFTHIGEVEVVFSEDENNNLIVKFIDTGIGISEGFLPRIFGSFSQEESGHTRRYEGNGLGLALVNGYCELNKIKIEVESKKGFGSTFTLTFPK
ncbi:MAG: PAS domain S-box protein [Melioribacteraceae bacterium]|nr:PAS domain S-box protein [Melioribacteraceae bacterium]